MTFTKLDVTKMARIELRVTKEEKEEIAAKAKDCNLSISEFALRAMQGRQTRTKHDLNLVVELAAMVRLLKQIYQGEKPREASELQPVLDSVVKAIDRIGEQSRIVL